MARTWDEIKRNIGLLNELLEEVGTDLKRIIQRYHDSDFYLRLLELEGVWTEEDASRLQEMTKGTRHHRNHRDVRTYVADLLLGWVVQDVVTELLSRSGCKCYPAGANSGRQLLTGRQVTEEPDLVLTISSEETWWLDVVTDYPTKRGALSYWMETKRCELRDNKFRRLMEKRKEGARVGLIGISVGAKRYWGLELTDELERELKNPPKRNRRIYHIETHWPFGGKPAIALNLRLLGVQFYPFCEFPKGLPFAEQITTLAKEG
jgi:hypothetical protein